MLRPLLDVLPRKRNLVGARPRRIAETSPHEHLKKFLPGNVTAPDFADRGGASPPDCAVVAWQLAARANLRIGRVRRTIGA